VIIICIQRYFSNQLLNHIAVNVSNYIFANDFLKRCVSALNSLPSVIANSKSVAAFKRALGSVDLSLFLTITLVLLSNCYALCIHLCIHLRVIIVDGVTFVVLYPVIIKECASFTSQLLIAVFIASLLNY